MVMMCQTLFDAVEAVEAKDPRPATRVLLTPQGRRYDQSMAEELASKKRLLLIAGHYEGFDERIIDGLKPLEVSIGDYVLSGGELAAMVLVDSVVRLLPGVLGHADGAADETFADGFARVPAVHATRASIAGCRSPTCCSAATIRRSPSGGWNNASFAPSSGGRICGPTGWSETLRSRNPSGSGNENLRRRRQRQTRSEKPAMRNKILDQVEASSLKTDIPQFTIGDTVDVHTRIVEGDKERIQVFSGTVLARKGAGTNETFIVRRIVNNEGVERGFPVHSPFIAKIVVKRGGETRRAKLYFLRERVGKAVRLTEKRKVAKKGEEGAAAAGSKQELAAAAAS